MIQEERQIVRFDTNKNISNDKYGDQSKGYDFIFKVVMIGDINVGKTSIIDSFINERPCAVASKATPSAEIQLKTMTMKDKASVKVQLWDTAGSEKYDALSSLHCRRAIGAIIVFDLQDRNSFKNIPKWINFVKEQADSECQIILLGNKVDLCTKNTIGNLNVEDVSPLD